MYIKIKTKDDLKAKRMLFADDLFSVIFNMDNYLREVAKNSDNDEAEKARQELHDELINHGIIIEHLYP